MSAAIRISARERFVAAPSRPMPDGMGEEHTTPRGQARGGGSSGAREGPDSMCIRSSRAVVLAMRVILGSNVDAGAAVAVQVVMDAHCPGAQGSRHASPSRDESH